jgi:hypothetical protein
LTLHRKFSNNNKKLKNELVSDSNKDEISNEYNETTTTTTTNLDDIKVRNYYYYYYYIIAL